MNSMERHFSFKIAVENLIIRNAPKILLNNINFELH